MYWRRRRLNRTRRTENVVKNAGFAVVIQLLTLLLSFFSRTVFIYVLGTEYLGINGLFTNVLTILSFVELGIGNAIIYNLYKPLAQDNTRKIQSLMAFYAKAYRIIGFTVFTLGMVLMFFIKYIIKDVPDIEDNLYFIYFLFLCNTTISYFFVYKKSIIIADQKNYIVLFYQQVCQFVQVFLQIIFLLITGNYILFLLIQIVCTLLNNVVMARKANKMYPYLMNKKVDRLSSKERTNIFENVKALFLYKFGSVILNGTDNIIISAFLGVTAVGLSSNYLLVISAVTTILGQFMSAFTASIGNLNAGEDQVSKERVFHKLFFISAWIYGFCGACLYLLLNPLIEVWLGEEYLLSGSVVFALVLHFYVNGVQFAGYTYRTTMGLFVQGKWTPIVAAFLNIILSLILVHPLGLTGVFLATSIARLMTTSIVDPYLVIHNGFSKSPISYYIKNLLFATLFVILVLNIKVALAFVSIKGFIGLITKLFVITILFNTALIAICYRMRDFQELKLVFFQIINNKLRLRSS